MSAIFLEILNMSISASYLILAIVLLRLPLKKAPKWISVALFGIAAVRLICPFSIESVLSLIPSADTVSPDIMVTPTPEINSGIPIIDNTFNPVISDAFKPELGASVNPLQIIVPVASVIWLCGIALLTVYALVSYLKIRSRVATAVLVRDNIYKSEGVASPFVLGIIKPKIYLPFSISPQDEAYVIAHEEAHIRRRDYLWKPLGFLILSIHWFNPLVWLGYILLCRDIEGACDEKVIKELDGERRADYSQALLNCSVSRRIISACPLAFGEGRVKERIKSVLNYKKPAFWIIVVAVIVSIVLSVVFLTNPVSHTDDGKKYLTEDNLLYAGEGSFSDYDFRTTASRYTGTCENLEWSSSDGIYIKTDYRAVSVSARIFSPGALEDYSTTVPDKYFIAPTIHGDKSVFIDIGWFYRASSEDQRGNQWSYLVIVTDENGVKHNYYFRVKYDLSLADEKRTADYIAYDIDGNGKNEICEIIEERKNGEYKVYLSITKDGNGTKIYKELGRGNAFSKFTVKTDGLYIDCPNYTSSFSHMPITRYRVSLENEEIELTKINTFTTPYYPALSSLWKKDFGTSGGKTEFKANLLLQEISLSSSFGIDISITDGDIYLNGILYRAYAEPNDNVVYEEALLLDADAKGLRDILNKIKDVEYFYELQTKNEASRIGRRVAVYEIEGAYYFLAFNEDGKVMRIHSAKIP